MVTGADSDLGGSTLADETDSWVEPDEIRAVLTRPWSDLLGVGAVASSRAKLIRATRAFGAGPGVSACRHPAPHPA
jgi:hypothetical protein